MLLKSGSNSGKVNSQGNVSDAYFGAMAKNLNATNHLRVLGCHFPRKGSVLKQVVVLTAEYEIRRKGHLLPVVSGVMDHKI